MITKLESWKFKTYIEFDDGSQWEYFKYYSSYQDEYGSTVGSFREDVERLAKQWKKIPISNIIEYWLMTTITYQGDDQFETTITFTQKLHKQKQSSPMWWNYASTDGIRLFLSEPNIFKDNVLVLDYFENWVGTQKAFSAYRKNKK